MSNKLPQVKYRCNSQLIKTCAIIWILVLNMLSGSAYIMAYKYTY